MKVYNERNESLKREWINSIMVLPWCYPWFLNDCHLCHLMTELATVHCAQPQIAPLQNIKVDCNMKSTFLYRIQAQLQLPQPASSGFQSPVLQNQQPWGRKSGRKLTLTTFMTTVGQGHLKWRDLETLVRTPPLEAVITFLSRTMRIMMTISR